MHQNKELPRFLPDPGARVSTGVRRLESELLLLLKGSDHMRWRNRITVAARGTITTIAAVIAVGTAVAAQQQQVNQKSAVIAEFQKRIASYMKLHNAAARQLPSLKSKASSGEISRYQHALASRIIASRPHAVQGEIFTPPIAAEFRRLIRTAMTGSRAHRIRSSLQRGAPVKSKIEVNHPYPAMAPLETTPPSLLLNLPKLPSGLEYRVVQHDLVLHDVKANLVVDFVPRAIR